LFSQTTLVLWNHMKYTYIGQFKIIKTVKKQSLEKMQNIKKWKLFIHELNVKIRISVDTSSVLNQAGRLLTYKTFNVMTANIMPFDTVIVVIIQNG